MSVDDRYDEWDLNTGGKLALPGVIIFRVASGVMSLLGMMSAWATPVLRSVLQEANTKAPNEPLTAGEIAMALQKEKIGRPMAESEARRVGVSDKRLDLLYQISSNPPSPRELLAQWRRKQIDRKAFRLGLRQGTLDPEWLDFYERFETEPLSAETYIRGAVEGDIGKAEAFQRALEEGLSNEDSDLLYRIMGNPPGIVQVLKLWQRGRITEQQVDDVIRDSHYKNRYIDMIKMYAEYYPPPRTVTAMLRNGSISRDYADELFQGNGMTAKLAQAMVAEATRAKTQAHKELSVTQVTGLLVDNILTEDEALKELSELGYAGDDAALLIRMAAAQTARKMRTEAIAGIRRVYVAGRIDATVAHTDLTQFGVGPDQQTALIRLWDLQRLAPSETLTVAQLGQAVKKQIITKDEYVKRIVAHGYTPQDAEILFQIQDK